MSVPGLVEAALGDESVAATVEIGGDDVLFVSPSRTLIYRSEGLLSDESIEEYPHDAERLTLAEGRRKSRIVLDYGLDGTETLSVPTAKLDQVLHPVLAGVLNAAGVTNPGETVLETFRFSELTIVVTSERVVKHIGEAVWDEEFEEFPFSAVTGLDFEDGSVAMQVVLTLGDRQERFKAPNQRARALRERIESALFEYYDVGSLRALHEEIADDDETAPAGSKSTETTESISFDAVEPLSTDPPTLDVDSGADAWTDSDPGADPVSDADDRDPIAPAATSDADEAATDDRSDGDASGTEGADPDGTGTSAPNDAFVDAGFEPAETAIDREIIDRLEAMSAAVDRQTELLQAQQRTLERLVDELKRTR